ncbi:EAL domain-containing protein [Marinobacter halophilus]|uniref:EAL domain-containing protein n=1 Tax=Marinobacter halophilus TaxID=1323740 RepID=A0A2T1KCB4_9GAMM|nr:EAL domain-containing protein [Marinobacter halophilus]PSF07774.1 hypothetical protein C7H08_10185 [Marinobacter halophilus]GGC56938.1 hypothetical protein GCM10011362_01630 [Marinobacter halophilus]
MPAHAVTEVGKDELAGHVRDVIRSVGFDLAFQPKVSFTHGRLGGVEVLVRWPEAAAGWRSPEQFVPFAERHGLAPMLDLHVLEQTLKLWNAWPALTRLCWSPFPVSVNVSAMSVQDENFLRSVTWLLASAPHPKLMFELTETAPFHDPDAAIHTLEALSGHGIQLSLDDFCTGFNCPERLRTLPVAELKIDREDTARLDTVWGIRRVGQMIEQAKAAGLTVTAEGIETRDQWQTLRTLGCDYGQGYWLCPPLPAKEAVEFVASYMPSRLLCANNEEE